MLGVAGGDDPSGGACMMGIALDRRSQEPLRHAAGEVEAQPFLEPTLSSSRKMVLKKTRWNFATTPSRITVYCL